MSYQFEEQGRGGDVHLKLILGEIPFPWLRNQCRIEIDIIDDAIKVILRRSADIAADTQGEFPFLVGQQETGSVRIMETHL